MALTVNPAVPATAAQAPGGAASGVVLQPGAVVNAQVLKVAENLVQIAIAGLAIDVISAVPLTVGQNLQLAVSQTDAGTVRLALVGQGTAAAAADAPNVALEAPAPVAPSSVAPPPNDPLTPLERIAVSVASESACQSRAAICRSQRRRSFQRPAASLARGCRWRADAANEPRPKPDGRRHSDCLSEIRLVARGVACRRNGPAGRRYPRSESCADCAAANARARCRGIRRSCRARAGGFCGFCKRRKVCTNGAD